MRGKQNARRPGIPSPRESRGTQGRGARGRDLAALTPASARAEKFARSRTPRALGQPAGGIESARRRRRRRAALPRPERREERAPADVRPELAWGRDRRPLGPRPPPSSPRPRPGPPEV